MHRLPKFFTSNKTKEMESISQPSTPRRPKPRTRLDRRNASKNINYKPPPPPPTSSGSNFFSSSSASNLSCSPDDSFAIRTRSIDVYPWGDRTSFRINGKDGELEFLCKSLGFSGPDDLGISTEDYEAMKARSGEVSRQISNSDNLSRLELQDDAEVSGNSRVSNLILANDQSEGYDVNASVDAKLCDGVLEDGILCSGVVKDVIVSDWTEDEGVKLVVSGRRSVGVGIKGERPPAVLLSPPPRMALPVIDAACSSWDILRSFGPEDDRISRTEDEQGESSSEDEGLHGAQGDAIQGVDVERRRRTVGLGSGVLSDSCSFTTNSDDDDSSSTTTDRMSISPSGSLKRQISSWEKGRHLGSGSYGSVYEGIADGGFFIAVKEVSLLDQGDKGREIIYQFEQEMAFLSQFEHKNIVRYYGTDKDDSNLYIFLELVPQGSLLSLYQRFHFQDSHVSVYTRQILEGLVYLHERNVVHRDIKCANILLDVDGYVKLADFGLAKVAKLNDAKSCKGTSYWMAPEVVKPNQWYGRAADIWSLGCTVLEMLTQNFPYHPLDGYQAMFKIGSGQPPPVPDFLSRDARDFILKCLQVDPDTRPSASELLEHPFVKRPHLAPASASPHHRGMRA